MKKTRLLFFMAAADFVILCATLVVFFVGFGISKKTTTDYAALTFVLISEAALFAGTALAARISRSRLFVRAGLLSTLILYWVITTLISIFYPFWAGDHINGLVTIQVIVFALAALAAIGIGMSAVHLAQAGGPTESDGNILQQCENDVFTLLSDKSLQEYTSQLKELYDALKYGDKTQSLPEQEQKIRNGIKSLRPLPENTSAAEDEIDKIEAIMALIKQRNQIVLQNKRGKC